MTKFLRERFIVIDQKFNLKSSIFEKLDRCYSESHRFYHNWDHIIYCLEQYDLIQGKLHDPVAVEIAIWFHDSVFYPGANNNELLSAKFAFDVFSNHSETLALKIKTFIEDTCYFEPSKLCDKDLDYFKDIDLSSFGKDFKDFETDVENLLKESSLIKTKADFIADCKTFYSNILNENFKLFRTEFFIQELRQKSFENIVAFQAKLCEL